MEIFIRPAAPSEALLLGAIEARCFPASEAASTDTISGRLAVFPENFLVAVAVNSVVGFIDGAAVDTPHLLDEFYHDTSFHKPDGAYQTVFGLNVLPEFRRNGIAEKLVKAFINISRARGKKGMILTCKEHLIHYYEKLGFKNFGLADSSHGGAVWYDMRMYF